MSVIVQLDGVSRVYRGAVPVHALQDVSLQVHQGESLAVMGPSGSGKSTLLGLIGCLDRPSSGLVCFAGADVASLSDRERSRLRARHLGFVFQQFHLVTHLSALANVEAALLFRGLPRAARRAMALSALDRVGLAARSSHHPSRLSGGEQQRVALARAIVASPSVILADEPTGNLDSASAARVLAVLDDFVAEGVTVVTVTHHDGVAAHAARRIEMLDGRIVRSASRVA